MESQPSPGSFRSNALLIACAVLAAALLVVVFVWRVSVSAARDSRLCGVLVHLVQESDAKLDSFAYYQEHPDELKRAHRMNSNTIAALGCEPIRP